MRSISYQSRTILLNFQSTVLSFRVPRIQSLLSSTMNLHFPSSSCCLADLEKRGIRVVNFRRSRKRSCRIYSLSIWRQAVLVWRMPDLELAVSPRIKPVEMEQAFALNEKATVLRFEAQLGNVTRSIPAWLFQRDLS